MCRAGSPKNLFHKRASAFVHYYFCALIASLLEILTIMQAALYSKLAIKEMALRINFNAYTQPPLN